VAAPDHLRHSVAEEMDVRGMTDVDENFQRLSHVRSGSYDPSTVVADQAVVLIVAINFSATRLKAAAT
jgi:hypothetical protein